MPIQIRRFASSNAIKLELTITGATLRQLQGTDSVEQAARNFAQCLQEAFENGTETDPLRGRNIVNL